MAWLGPLQSYNQGVSWGWVLSWSPWGRIQFHTHDCWWHSVLCRLPRVFTFFAICWPEAVLSSSLHGLFYVSAHISVCFFKTIKKESLQRWLLWSYVMYHVLLVTCAVFCWLEVSLRSCPHSRAEDHTRAWSWGNSRVCLPNLLILRMKKQAQRDDLAFRRYSCLVEELRVDAPPFNFKPVLEPESGSVKLSMLLNFFEPQFS